MSPEIFAVDYSELNIEKDPEAEVPRRYCVVRCSCSDAQISLYKESQNCGIVIKSPSGLAVSVDLFSDGCTPKLFQFRLSKQQNIAVFTLPSDFISQINKTVYISLYSTADVFRLSHWSRKSLPFDSVPAVFNWFR